MASRTVVTISSSGGVVVVDNELDEFGVAPSLFNGDDSELCLDLGGVSRIDALVGVGCLKKSSSIRTLSSIFFKSFLSSSFSSLNSRSETDEDVSDTDCLPSLALVEGIGATGSLFVASAVTSSELLSMFSVDSFDVHADTFIESAIVSGVIDDTGDSSS